MSQEKEVPYVVVEKRSSGLGAFLLGAVAGALGGLLFAPKSGEETQKELKEGAVKLRSDAEDRLRDLRGELADVYDRARSDVAARLDSARGEVEERKRRAEQAVRAGRGAARSAREDLERRVEESKEAYREAVGEEDDFGAGDGEPETARRETGGSASATSRAGGESPKSESSGIVGDEA